MKVSVIIPAGRGSASIDSCLESLLVQDVPFDYEIIVTGAEIELPREERVRFVRVDDRNPAVRRNRAAAAARGEILAFIDDDAIAAPDWIERGARLLESDPSIRLVGGPDPAPQ
ncbi:MAG: glycosyltransferase family A protein, partial [Thermoanaerobaculia bacterium]|nr:glycosyltransferase family A protein [Thermoanaerobaculia bacterium]